jgi:hypothetical protein
MSAAPKFNRPDTWIPLSDAALLAFARVICGVRVDPECLPPEIEAMATDAFRSLADWLKNHAQQRRQS